MKIIDLQTADSTMLEARDRLAGQSPEAMPFAIRVKTQTAGRGRQQREWASPEGGIWLTVAWPVERGTDITSLPPRVALAVIYAIEHVTDVRAGSLPIKWPNDVLHGGCKLVGVMCELVEGALLIGVGVNANFDAADLPQELRMAGTTLREALGNDVDTEALTAELLTRLSNMLEAPAWSPQLAEVFRSRIAYLGEPIRLESPASAIEGTLVGVDDDASLILRTEQGEHRIRSGEIVRLRLAAAEPTERA